MTPLLLIGSHHRVICYRIRGIDLAAKIGGQYRIANAWGGRRRGHL